MDCLLAEKKKTLPKQSHTETDSDNDSNMEAASLGALGAMHRVYAANLNVP